jgi:hypothetical protein
MNYSNLSNDLEGYTLTAISTCEQGVVVKLRAFLKVVHIVCTKALTINDLAENISILRLKDQDRSVACVNIMRLGREMLISFVLAGGVSLLVRANTIRVEHLDDVEEGTERR